jgi:capsular exopolysaccharide synthesis family protein
MTRKYEATGVFQLQKSSSDGLDLESLMGGGGAGGASDSLSLTTDLETQADILKSDTLALDVIKKLNLEHNRDFLPRFNPVAWAMGLISPKGPADPANAALEDSPHRRAHVLRVFSKALDVRVNAGTRLIEVQYTNSDPRVAAAVVNDLIQALIDYTFQTKFTATNQVSQWLESQLGDLRKQSEDLQAKVVALQQTSGIFGAGGTDLQGKPVIYSPVLDRLAESTAQLSQAKMNRILKQSVWEVIKTGNAELISQLSGTAMGGASGGSAGVASSLTVIQNLRMQEATTQAQIDQDATQLGPAYPKLVQERASLKSIQQEIHDEIARVAARAKNDYDVAQQAEQGASATYESDRGEAEKLNDKSIEYAIASKEADQSQELYQDLLKRLKEAGIMEGLHSSNLTIVDNASPPAQPSKPNVPLYLALGLVLGFFFGGGGALLVDSVDNKLQGGEEIEAMGMPLLGIVPHLKEASSPRGIVIADEPNSIFSESIRSLRSVIMISRSGTPPRVILVTSGSPSEGKSTISLNLAASLAQQDKRVLLIEADLRRPVLRQRLNLIAEGGLSSMLANQGETLEAIPSQTQPNLYFMPAGPAPPFPTELLGSARMGALLAEWRKQFDFVVIDSPPILPVADARLLIPLADTTVLVARAARTTRVALQRAYGILIQHASDQALPSVGTVFNGVSLHSAGYYGYYGYYGTKNSAYYQQGGKK